MTLYFRIALIASCFALISSLKAAWEKIQPVGRTSANISDIAYGAETWIAVGERGLIARLDADNRWGELPSPISSKLNDIIHTGDRFVAVGDNGVILISSPTAVETWSIATSGVAQKLLRIERFDSTFFILGENGLILRSTDGVAWSVHRKADSDGPKFEALVKFNGEFFGIVGRKVWRSADAATWALDAAADSKVDYVQNVRVLNNQLVAWGHFRAIARSTDGRLWTTLTCPLTGSSDAVVDMAFTNGRYLLVGTDNLLAESRPVYASTNLVSWTATDGTAVRRIVEGGGRLIAASLTGHETSTDGLRWHKPDAQLFQPIVFQDGAFRGADRGFIYSSSNGRDWTRAELPTGIQASEGIQSANGRYLVSSGTKVAVSSDLTNWQTGTLAISGPVRDFQYTFGKYYALIPRSSFLPYYVNYTLAVSTNGQSWTSLSLDAAQLASSSERIVVVDGANNVFYSKVSTNGTNYTSHTYSEPAPSDIAYGNGVFVAVSASVGYELRVSIDGATWTRVPTTYPGPQSITFANGLFVARSRGGYLFTSANGLDWTVTTYPVWTQTLPGSSGLTSAYGNGRWLLTKDTPLLSSDLRNFEPLTAPVDQNFVRVRHLNDSYWALSHSTDSTVASTLWRSDANGRSWAPIKYFSARITDIAVAPTGYLVVADGNTVWTSSDLAAWQEFPTATSLGQARAAVFFEGYFYAATQTGLRRSSDGITWEAAPGLPSFNTYDVISTPLGLTAAGGTSMRGVVYHSLDGQTWTQVWSDYRPQYIRTLAYSDHRLIAAGDYGFLIHSPDGLTWSAAYAGEAQSTIEQSSGTASGLLTLSGGTLRISDHTELATHREEPIAARLNSVAFANGISIAVGNDASLYRRADAGITPTPTVFSVSDVGDRYADLAWSAAPANAGFIIEYRLVGAADWKRLDYLIGVNERTLRLGGLAPETNYEIRIRSLSAGSSPSIAAIGPSTTNTLSSIANWRKIHLGDPSGTGIGGNLMDPDNDGMPNLLEYALGHEPTTGEASSITAFATPSSPGFVSYGIEFWCDALNTDIDYIVEHSTDLQTWVIVGTASGGGRFETTAGGFGSANDAYYGPANEPYRRVRVSITTSQSSQYFRLKIAPKPSTSTASVYSVTP